MLGVLPAEDLLVAWLNELIYLIGTQRWVPSRVATVAVDRDGLRAELDGASLGNARPALEIKAATFGGLAVRRDSKGDWRTTVILDV